MGFTDSKLWQTRNHRWLIAYFFVIIIAFTLLAIGFWYIRNSNSASSTYYPYYLSDITGSSNLNFLSPSVELFEEAQFDVPTSYRDKTVPVTIKITLSSDSYFAENTLFNVNATAIVNNDRQSSGIAINSIQVQLLNALDVTPNEFSALGFTTLYSHPTSYSGITYLYRQTPIEETENIFSGTISVTFQNNCSITCNIRFYINRDYSNYTLQEEIDSYLTQENLSFLHDVNFNHTFSNFYVKDYLELSETQRTNLQIMATQRQQAIQVKLQALQTAIIQQNQAIQKDSENMNLGFTFVIMFLAVIEISFIVYEQSKDEELEAEYRYKKAIEKYHYVV